MKRCKVTVPTEKKGFLTSGGGGDLSPAEKGVTAKDAFHVARRKAYIEAIKMWNEEDHSTRERIVEPDPWLDESEGGSSPCAILIGAQCQLLTR